MGHKYDKNILYVEDEFVIRTSIINILSKLFDSKNIYVAKDGQEGLELFKKNKIDIVLTDIKMEPIDGIEMSKAIRSKDNNVPIIVLSAFEKEMFNLDDLNISEYLIKPVTKFKLMEILETYIESSKK